MKAGLLEQIENLKKKREQADNPIDEDEDLKLLKSLSRIDSAGEKRRRREQKWNGLGAEFMKKKIPQV